MVIGFKEQFKQPILKGTKIHTIREDKRKRWVVGNKIHFATNVRTKKQKQFKEGECMYIQEIQISSFMDSVFIDGKPLNLVERILLAKNDGFKGLIEFYNWFKEDFHGKLIQWTDFKY